MAQGISQRTGGFIAVGLTLALALLIYIQATTTMSTEAASFPKLIALVLLVASGVLLLKTFYLPGKDTGKPMLAGIKWKNLFAIAFLWLISLIIPGYLGFYTDIFLFMVLASCYLTGVSLKSLRISILYAAITTLLLWGVFSVFLKLSLPRGWFI